MTTPLTITPGKFYRTRDGRKAGIYATDGCGLYPVHGYIITGGGKETSCWNAVGLWGPNLVISSHLDLIAEWVDEPEGSWDGCPAWANWRAKDEDGSWWWYDQRPVLIEQNGNWRHAKLTKLSGIIPSSHTPTFTGDWKDSLQQRPEETK